MRRGSVALSGARHTIPSEVHLSRGVALGLVLSIGALALLVLWRASPERALERSVPESPTPEPSGRSEDVVLSGGVEVPPETVFAPAGGAEQPAAATQRSPTPDERPRITGTVRAPRDVLARANARVRGEVVSKTKGVP